ncbi:MAG: hypothetical protein U0L26_07030 [Cellulosilyticum sp.]|nr:hypothetical protein [Cellulosilyticum sp.]
MNIRWCYYLIAGIYMLLIILRGINYLNETAYKKENLHYRKVFSIKKDFFTTVAVICMGVTIAINIAALVGGKALNTSSILVTILVIGLTLLNSFTFILFSEEEENICLLGYTLLKGDITDLKVKKGKNQYRLNLNFNKEVESYNYAKILIFGANKEALTGVLEKLVESKKIK